MAAAAMATGRIDPVVLVKIAGVLSLAGTLVVTYRMGRLWLRPIAAAVPPLLLIQYRGTVYWAVSGLETAAYGFAFLLALYLGLRAFYSPEEAAPEESSRTERSSPLRLWCLVAASVCALAAALLRPEGPLAILVLVLFVGWKQWRVQGLRAIATRPLAALVLPFALGYVAYFVWRASYFGALLPNTVYCKAAYEGDPWTLIVQFLTGARLLPLALVPLLLRPSARNIVLYVPVALYVAILYNVSPTVAQMNRHFLVVFPLVYVAAVVGVFRLVSLGRSGDRGTIREALGVVLALSLVLAIPSVEPRRLERLSGAYAERQLVREELGTWLKHETEPDDWYAIGDAGITPYTSGGKVIDLYCLNCREMTREPVSFSSERFADWLFGTKPRFLVMHSGSKTDFEPLWPPHVEVASHPDFSAHYRLRERFNTRGRHFNYWIYERN